MQTLRLLARSTGRVNRWWSGLLRFSDPRAWNTFRNVRFFYLPLLCRRRCIGGIRSCVFSVLLSSTSQCSQPDQPAMHLEINVLWRAPQHLICRKNIFVSQVATMVKFCCPSPGSTATAVDVWSLCSYVACSKIRGRDSRDKRVRI